MGLSLNVNKTQIVRGPIEDDEFSVSFAYIASDIAEVLDIESAHKYCGK